MITSSLAYQFSSFANLPLVHGLSGRVDGWPFEGDVGHGRGTTPAEIEVNRTAFLHELALASDSLTLGRQTHGERVQIVGSSDRSKGRYPAFDGFPETDALVTNDPEVVLGVIVADCVPILLYDPEHHAVAAIHAGWRGTVAGIATNAITVMVECFSTHPGTLIAAIGPSIGPCCYEGGVEVVNAWRGRDDLVDNDAIRRADSSYHFDLWAANRQLLIASGVCDDRIEVSGVCVRCQIGRYFSYRAASQGVAHPGRMLMVAKLEPLA